MSAKIQYAKIRNNFNLAIYIYKVINNKNVDNPYWLCD